MIRIVLLNLLLLLLPTLLYIGYTHLTAPGRPKTIARMLEDGPVVWLLGLGGLLALATMLFFATVPEGRPGDAYSPPVFRDGELVPGRLGQEKTGGQDAPERQ